MAFEIRSDWEASILILCDPGDMARRHSLAVHAYAVAVSTAGSADAVTASCGATLAHLGRMIDAVGSMLNRNLTAAYWERVEEVLSLGEVRCESWG